MASDRCLNISVNFEGPKMVEHNLEFPRLGWILIQFCLRKNVALNKDDVQTSSQLIQMFIETPSTIIICQLNSYLPS